MVTASSEMSSQGDATPRSGSGLRVRWLLAVVVVAAAVMVIAGLWLAPDLARGMRVFFTTVTSLATVLLLVLWLVFLSGLRWRTRLVWLAAAAGAFGVFLALVRVEGFTGDVAPIFSWRWAPTREDAVTRHRRETAHAAVPAVAVDLTRRWGQDYPQFLGPDRSGILKGEGLARDWQARPPKELWRQPVGLGMSAFAVAGGYAVTQEQRGSDEVVACYEVETERECWVHADKTRFSETLGGDGPRATPTIHAGRVYALGASGILNCLEGATGRPVWTVNILQDNSAPNITWGMAGSPLILEDLVVVHPGGTSGASLAAYHKQTGKRVWQGGSDPAGYTSPMLAELGGVRQILILNGVALAAHDPESGKVLWRYEWKTQQGINASQPVAVGSDRVFLSAGYGMGCALLEVKQADGQWSAKEVWKSRNLNAKFTNVVVREGFVYGLDEGILVCVNLADGRRAWKGGRYGHGQVILVDDLLLVQAESGEVALVEVSPKAGREVAKLAALKGKTWNHAALAGRYLLVRNEAEAACYELAGEKP